MPSMILKHYLNSNGSVTILRQDTLSLSLTLTLTIFRVSAVPTPNQGCTSTRDYRRIVRSSIKETRSFRTKHNVKLEVSDDVSCVDYIPNSGVGVSRVMLTELYRNPKELISKARNNCHRFNKLVYIVEQSPTTKKKVSFSRC